MELSGKVKSIGELIQVSPTFMKQELVITTDEQYPQHIIIEFVQDKVDLLANLPIGTNIKVSINLGGREWVNPQGETKYFNSIKGWRIEREDTSHHPQPNTANTQNTPKEYPQSNQPNSFVDGKAEEEYNDLPF